MLNGSTSRHNPGLFPLFSVPIVRDLSGFRFILNDSKAITTNVYLLLYPKPQYASCMKDKGVLNEVWHELNAIPTETISQNGRFYGGGLRKMEPKELMRTPAQGLASVLTGRKSYQEPTLF